MRIGKESVQKCAARNLTAAYAAAVSCTLVSHRIVSIRVWNNLYFLVLYVYVVAFLFNVTLAGAEFHVPKFETHQNPARFTSY